MYDFANKMLSISFLLFKSLKPTLYVELSIDVKIVTKFENVVYNFISCI